MIKKGWHELQNSAPFRKSHWYRHDEGGYHVVIGFVSVGTNLNSTVRVSSWSYLDNPADGDVSFNIMHKGRCWHQYFRGGTPSEISLGRMARSFWNRVLEADAECTEDTP